MSFISVDTYWFNKIVDERIEQAFNVASEYSGCGLFDADGKLVDTGSYQLTKGTLLEIIQYQQEQITQQDSRIDSAFKNIEILLDDFSVAWKDLQGYKDECRGLYTSECINSNAIDLLLERVKVLEKEVNSGLGLNLHERVKVLEKEVEKL